MTDALRDRIAAAIYNSSDEYARKLMVRPDCPGAADVEGDSKPVCYLWADAVIRELGIYEDEMGTGDTRRTRIVSDWEKP